MPSRGCRNPGLSALSWWGGAASDHQTFTPVQMGQCRLIWCQEAPGCGRQGPRNWQACRAAPPQPPPRRCKQTSHRLPLLIVRGNTASQHLFGGN